MIVTKTLAFCHTREAILRIEDGDVVEHLPSGVYYMYKKTKVYYSFNGVEWAPAKLDIHFFPAYDEWRSVLNTFYYQEVKRSPDRLVYYLTDEHKIVPETHPKADRMKKRWFHYRPLLGDVS